MLLNFGLLSVTTESLRLPVFMVLAIPVFIIDLRLAFGESLGTRGLGDTEATPDLRLSSAPLSKLALFIFVRTFSVKSLILKLADSK